jgi:hypothetical protein
MAMDKIEGPGPTGLRVVQGMEHAILKPAPTDPAMK